MRNFAIFAVGSVCLITGCAGTGAEYQPIVDTSRGAQYQSDLASCQALSETKSLMNPETKTMAAAGAMLGATAGFDDEADGERIESGIVGAVLGGLLGAAGGSVGSHFERQDIIKNCLTGRGYNVVG